MKLDDLGINSKTGYHDRRLTLEENRFLSVLWVDHVGNKNKITALDLAIRFDLAIKGISPESDALPAIMSRLRKRPWWEKAKRRVRRMQTHLLVMHENCAVLSRAGHNGGYWMSENKAEAEAFYSTFRKRGMTGLVKASRGKKAAMVGMVEQMTFEFEALAESTNIPYISERGEPAAIAVVDSFLGRMLENPEQFSSGLRMLSKKYGSVLLAKGQLAEMKAKAAELQAMVASL